MPTTQWFGTFSSLAFRYTFGGHSTVASAAFSQSRDRGTFFFREHRQITGLSAAAPKCPAKTESFLACGFLLLRNGCAHRFISFSVPPFLATASSLTFFVSMNVIRLGPLFFLMFGGDTTVKTYHYYYYTLHNWPLKNRAGKGQWVVSVRAWNVSIFLSQRKKNFLRHEYPVAVAFMSGPHAMNKNGTGAKVVPR